VIWCPDFKACLFPLAGGEPRAIPELESVDVPNQFPGGSCTRRSPAAFTAPCYASNVHLSLIPGSSGALGGYLMPCTT
jgi:hypothetical protein